MPLDALNRNTLLDAAVAVGIEPIPSADLDAYRNEMVRRHPGSWWRDYPHVALMTVLLGFCASTILVGMNLLCLPSMIDGSLKPPISDLIAFAVSVVVLYKLLRSGVLMKGLTITHPAFWSEITCGEQPHLAALYANTSIPPSILEMAERIIEFDPAEIVVGKLRQNSVTIDPYLVLRRGTDEIVLGIWDDRGIIRQAIQR